MVVCNNHFTTVLAVVNKISDKEETRFVDCTFSKIDFSKIIAIAPFELIFIGCDFYACSFRQGYSDENAHLLIQYMQCYFRLCDIGYDDIKALLFNVRILNSTISDITGTDIAAYNLYIADSKISNVYITNTKLCDIFVDDPSSIKNCDFSKANFHDLRITSAVDIENVSYPFIRNICGEGDIIGWKKAYIYEDSPYYNDNEKYIIVQRPKECIVKLLIPSDAKRLSSINGKCRCDKAKVLELYNLSSDVPLDDECTAKSIFLLKKIAYKKNEFVYANAFDDNPMRECSMGIHFFMTREEAEKYRY